MQRRTFLKLGATAAGGILMGSTLRRLLLVTGSGGSFTASPTTGLQQLTADLVGGHSEPQWPKAVGNNGYTYYGGINGTNGDVGILAVNDTTLATTWTVLFPALGGEGTADLHDNSALIVLPGSGKLLTWTCRHADSRVRQRISTSTLADDPMLANGFGSTTDVDLGNLHDYPVLLIMNSTLYGFIRNIPSGTVDAHLTYTTTADLSAATGWAAPTSLYNNPGKTTYWQIASDASLIHVLTFDRNEGEAPGGVNNLKHFTMDAAGDLFQTDGSAIVASLPLAPADIDTIAASTGGHHLWNLELFSGNPVTAVTAYPNGYPTGPTFIRRVEWNGSAWSASDVDSAAGFGMAWGCAIHPGDRNRVIVAVDEGGARDLREYTWTGAVWSESQLAGGVDTDEWVFPVATRSPGRVKVIAMKGEYNTYLDWATAVWGLVED